MDRNFAGRGGEPNLHQIIPPLHSLYPDAASSAKSVREVVFDYRVIYIDIQLYHFSLPSEEIKIFSLLYAL
jgi:hypothetical protein